jgi:RNA polymerase sigma-70 factor (ECF subfamily)
MDVKSSSLEPQKWVESYGDYLFSYARTRVNDVEYAKDLVQETFLSALSKIESFKGNSSIRTWLTAILKNKIIDGYRKKSIPTVSNDILDWVNKRIDFFDKEGGWSESNKPLELGFEDEKALENKDLKRILNLCFEKLPDTWRMVFIMKHVEDEKSSNICKELKITPSNFWVIIHRAKLSLRDCLQKNEI